MASIKLIQDAERSNVTESGLEALSEKSSEVWVIRLPKNVSNAGRAQVVILVRGYECIIQVERAFDKMSMLAENEICKNGGLM